MTFHTVGVSVCCAASPLHQFRVRNRAGASSTEIGHYFYLLSHVGCGWAELNWDWTVCYSPFPRELGIGIALGPLRFA